MDVGWNFRREHLRLQQRSHYVIINGGDQPNVVPSEAGAWYYFRELDYSHIKELYDLGDTMAKAAAMMTGTSVTQRLVGSVELNGLNLDGNTLPTDTTPGLSVSAGHMIVSNQSSAPTAEARRPAPGHGFGFTVCTSSGVTLQRSPAVVILDRLRGACERVE